MRASRHLTAVYKPNLAFYLAYDRDGLWVLRETVDYIKRVAPEVPVILDAKFGDIGNTNLGYVRFIADFIDADAVTVAPYMGRESLKPFLDRADKGVFILCRTSNSGADEFQGLNVVTDWGPGGTMPLYQYVAMKVAKDWDENGNCALVVGATAPAELAKVREIAPDLPILIPGVGAQGGDLEASVAAAKHRFLINSSRAIIFASQGEDFADAARRETQKLHRQIATCVATVGAR